MNRALTWGLAATVAVGVAAGAVACPFCQGGKTLIQEAGQATIILFGTTSNARLSTDDLNAGTTDYSVELVIKSHELVAGKKQIVLPRYIPLEKGYKYLSFCDVYKGELDPYRGIPVPESSRIGVYLQKGMELRDQPVEKRLPFYFDYLDDADAEVSNDAYTEFANATYAEIRRVTPKLSAERVRGWLRDPSLTSLRVGLYASLLGHCGTPADAGQLRAMLDQGDRYLGGLDGVLAGYVLLNPAEGRKYLGDLLADRQQKFLLRYAGLRAARFFWEYRPDVLSKDAVTALVRPLLDQSDIADMAVEDLGKWGAWSEAERVVGLLGAEEVKPILRKAILNYALRCPPGTNAKLDAYLKAERERDPDGVAQTLEFLRVESKPAEQPAAAPKPAPKTVRP